MNRESHPVFPDFDRGSASPAHAVQFYDGDVRRLAPAVCRYLSEGLRAGGAAIVIATAAHRRAFADRLRADGVDPDVAVSEGRLVLQDAQQTLARFMVREQPDWERFKTTI